MVHGEIMIDKKVRCVIIGGGISGLTFANKLGEKDYLIIEKENSVGGYAGPLIELEEYPD